MSTSSSSEEDHGEEHNKKQLADGGESYDVVLKQPQKKVLTLDEASECLNMLGKDESSMRYAYLRATCCDLHLTDVRVLLNFRHVLFVDVSGNFLTTPALQCIAPMPFVVQLYAKRNLLEHCDLIPMAYLQDLSLARNRLKNTLGIRQPALEYLDLNYNQIFQIVIHSEDVPALLELEVRGNYLFELGGVLPITLQRLYLAENKISRIVGAEIDHLEHLQVLHLRRNHIRHLNGFTSKLRSLKYLNLRENKIATIRQLRHLQCLPALEVLIVLQNPIVGDAGNMWATAMGDDAPVGAEMGTAEEEEEGDEGAMRIDGNRIAILTLLPNLKRINKVPVTYGEREMALLRHDAFLTQIMAAESSDEEEEVEPPSVSYSTLQETSVEQYDELYE